MNNQKTFFDLDGFTNAKPATAQPPKRWVIFYEHDGVTYLGRKTNDPHRAEWEWLVEGEDTRKPQRYKAIANARRAANALNKRRTAAGEQQNVIVRVKAWTG